MIVIKVVEILHFFRKNLKIKNKMKLSQKLKKKLFKQIYSCLVLLRKIYKIKYNFIKNQNFSIVLLPSFVGMQKLRHNLKATEQINVT